jgi:uncharacterized protein YkwD
VTCAPQRVRRLHTGRAVLVLLAAMAAGLVLGGGWPARGTLAATPAAAPGTPAVSESPAASGTPTPSLAPAASGTLAASATPTAVATPAVSATPAVAVSPTPAVAATPAVADDPFREREDQLALQLARARVEAGLPPLARSAALDRAAGAHARDMAAQGYMEHDAPDGSTPASRAAGEGYQTPAGSAWLVIEVISAQGDAPEAALGWWLSDSVHRRVVLGARWREIGIGYAAGGPYGRFWVADVGCRPDVLPPVLLDGQLTIPDEHCGQSATAFSGVQSVRVAETSAAAKALEWAPYISHQPWQAGHAAVVELRDAAGHELEAQATDPAGHLAESP